MPSDGSPATQNRRLLTGVLRVKFELGLFEHPYVDADEAALIAALRMRACPLRASRVSMAARSSDDPDSAR